VWRDRPKLLAGPVLNADCCVFPAEGEWMGTVVHWWQWVLQVTGAWFYVGLIAVWLWIVVKSRWSERRAPQAPRQKEKAFRHVE
jgi:hypothetical protein